MSAKLMAFVLAAALAAFAQGNSSGQPRNAPPPTTNPTDAQPAEPTKAAPTAKPAAEKKADNPSSGASPADSQPGNVSTQQALTESQLKSGAFVALQEKTGKTSEELQQMYSASGAKTFGQFNSAVIVAKNLNLDTSAVLEGLKTKTLGQTLRDMGVSEEAASAEIAKAKKEMKEANKKKSS